MADPSERALDNPALGQNDEAMRLVAFDDLQLQATGLGDGCCRLGSLVASIGEDAFDEGEYPVSQCADVTLPTMTAADAILRNDRLSGLRRPANNVKFLHLLLPTFATLIMPYRA